MNCDALEDDSLLVQVGIRANDVLAIALEFARMADRDFPLALLDLVETVGDLTRLVRAWASSGVSCAEADTQRLMAEEGPDSHPEELLERDANGELSPGELATLELHINRCAACTFERLVRRDFRRDR